MVHQIQHTAPALMVRTDIARCLWSPIYYTDQGSITAPQPVYFSGVTLKPFFVRTYVMSATHSLFGSWVEFTLDQGL